MITLYYAPDNASLIVRILLEELGLPYETVLVDRSTIEQQSEQYLNINPNGLIPVCVINQTPVYETAAIVLSLADTHQRFNVTLDNDQRPTFLKWLFYLSNSLHVDCRMRFYPEKYAGSNAGQDFYDITFNRLCERLNILNAAYKAAPNNYLFGSEPVIVDFYLAVCLRWLQLYPVKEKGRLDIAAFPELQTMARELESRQKVIAACGLEGISGAFFTQPAYACPSEGVAL